jgi:hypothetical protein
VRDGQPARAGRPNVQHQVGERQVRDQLPLADEAVQPVDVLLVEGRPREDQVTSVDTGPA